MMQGGIIIEREHKGGIKICLFTRSFCEGRDERYQKMAPLGGDINVRVLYVQGISYRKFN
jgi:hypothetical protein